MKFKQLKENAYSVCLDKDELVMSQLKEFVISQNIQSGSISAIGALKNTRLGFYHLDKKAYDEKVFHEEAELVSLIGNISWLRDNTPVVHCHVSLGLPDFSVVGGHLFEATVAVTGEFLIFTFPETVFRSRSESIGLNLLDLRCSPH